VDERPDCLRNRHQGIYITNGPESGTFNSLRTNLDYLRNLGINDIWLTGYSLCDLRHFYNIWTDRREPNLKAVSYQSNLEVPVPYIRWNGQAAIWVAGNRNSDRDANLKPRIPLEEIGLNGRKNYRVSDLWSDNRARSYREDELDSFHFTIKPDKSAGGGIAAFRIDPGGG